MPPAWSNLPRTSSFPPTCSPPGSRPGTPRRMISYHEFYDALGSQCDPSYTLRGGKSSSSAVDVTTIASMVSAGCSVASTQPMAERREASTRSSSGVTCGLKRASGVPSALMTNFSKFHRMSPLSPASSGVSTRPA